MTEITLTRDDLSSLLEIEGITSILEELATLNIPMSSLICEIKVWARQHKIDLRGLDSYQVERIIADLTGAGKLLGAQLIEGSNANAVSRATAPTGLGCSGGNVWCTPPAESYVLRFYTNGILKLTLTNYYITSLESIGAASGDVVQICQVIDGIVGWWSKITVP